jgi:hypothetical protein
VRERALPRAIPPLRAAAGEEEEAAGAQRGRGHPRGPAEAQCDRDREGRRGLGRSTCKVLMFRTSASVLD